MPQTILITGANRGIGLALARHYLANGDEVIATCRNPAKASELQKSAKQHASLTILPLDVQDHASIAALTQALKGRPIDVLINNAGILSGSNPSMSAIDSDKGQTFGSLDVPSWLKVFEVNTIAPIMVTQALMPNLLAAQTRKVAMMSSGWGSITRMNSDIPFAYGTSKAALNAATKILSSALQKDEFVVVSLNPGAVKTDMGSQQADWSPEECATRLVPIIDALKPEQTGQFIRHTGEIVAW